MVALFRAGCCVARMAIHMPCCACAWYLLLTTPPASALRRTRPTSLTNLMWNAPVVTSHGHWDVVKGAPSSPITEGTALGTAALGRYNDLVRRLCLDAVEGASVSAAAIPTCCTCLRRLLCCRWYGVAPGSVVIGVVSGSAVNPTGASVKSAAHVPRPCGGQRWQIAWSFGQRRRDGPHCGQRHWSGL